MVRQNCCQDIEILGPLVTALPFPSVIEWFFSLTESHYKHATNTFGNSHI